MKIAKKLTSGLLIVSMMFLSSCAGRTPHPVQCQQYGDYEKSCEQLNIEIFQAQSEMNKLIHEKDKLAQNVALGVAGAFFLVPWFFMDFKNAEATEYEAYRQRYNHLMSISMSKNCGIKKENYPSIEELKKKYEEKNKKLRNS